jgi:hypothetical protein
MDPEIKLIDQYERLFAETGWKELVDDFAERVVNIKSQILADTTMTERQLAYQQGIASVYNYIIGLEGLIDHIKQEKKVNAIE